MSCNRGFPPSEFEVETYSGSLSYEWATDFVLAAGMSVVDLMLLLRNVDGNFTGKGCYQTAAVRADNPDAVTVMTAGAYTGTAGYTLFHETLAITDKLLIRFGTAYKNSAGTTLGRASGQVTVGARQCGAAVGSTSVLVNAGMVTTTDINYFPIGDFKLAVGLDKLMGAFVVTDNDSSYLEYSMVIRTAKDPRAPNAWQTMEAAWANPLTANTERNTTLLAIPAGANLTSNMFYQAGLAIRKKAGAAGNPRAQIQAMVAATYA